ncbi:NAD(P)-dependent alcohol dehydrogenase [Auraticoccus monumenti]|uniref:alcohol dehydrogenase (NADP(+)) n=1 Tax=Auraticoccus monumenti TaxID=675864 RepID=A0A1G6ZB82_9ACTN|nr:NAD(P)-dependent alcohol dehydrogenase [Auraticoccus monumenti]SDD99761.1 uncharacterized zinc-type alcohol dehydrogenase-like protein [Auraticoccus monumenti]
MRQIEAMAVDRPGAGFRPHHYESGPLGPDEVDVQVTHAGVCHSDIGMIDDEYGISRYPVVAGHESVGVVVGLGSAVDSSQLRLGDRVGVGPIAGSCMRCVWCRSGRTQLCASRDDTVMRGDRGGFASHVRASSWQHVYRIPDEITSAEAAPLLCAGSTVFAPLLRHGVRPVDRVAVVGIGGLGHLAIQFMSRWGCHVTAVSGSAGKEEAALALGASAFLNSRDEGALGWVRGTFDLILSTVSADLPWDQYVDALRPGGTLSIVGLPAAAISVSPMSLLPQAKVVAGGVPGSIEDNRAMLDFAARHGVRPVVEIHSAGDADRALRSVREGTARYRAVIEM